MKYYSEDETKEIRAAFEREVLNWGQVSTKKMFGCPCYKVNNRLFAFLVTNGIVVTRLRQNEKKELSFKPGSTFFHTGKKYVKNWPQIPVRTIEELKTALPFVKESYKQALQGV